MTPLGITPSALAAKAPDSERARLTAAAQKFEAIFVRQMLSAARKTDFGGEDAIGGHGMDTFRQMQDERFADIAATRGAFGIAKALEAQLVRQIETNDRVRPSTGSGRAGLLPNSPSPAHAEPVEAHAPTSMHGRGA